MPMERDAVSARVEETRPIVVGVDGSDSALKAVEWAARAAQLCGRRLRLVNAIGVRSAHAQASQQSRLLRTALSEQSETVLAEAGKTAQNTAEVDIDTRSYDGEPGLVLLHESQTAKLTVVGPDGVGWLGRHVLGSTVLEVATRAHGPVVVVRGERERFDDGPVVVGLDGSPLSDAALRHAFDVAAGCGVPLIAVHTWFDDEDAYGLAARAFSVNWEPVGHHADNVLAEQLTGWAPHYPEVAVERRVIRDRAKHTLLDFSRHARLVVVGSRGRGRLAATLLGSVSQALIARADCPVMIARTTAR